MKKKSILGVVCCAFLTSSVLTACSSKSDSASSSSEKTTIKSSTKKSSSQEEKSGFDASDYLTIDTSKIEGFELSPLVKDVVGTYSGVIKANHTKYEVKINKDGTYTMVSYDVTVLGDMATNEVNTYPYLDKSDTQVNIPLTWEEDGETLGMYNGFILDRGVLIEKYGQLQYQSVSKTSGSVYIDTDGNVDFVKGLVKSEVSVTGKLPDTEANYESFIVDQFSSGDKYIYDENIVELYIEDRKLYVGEEELSSSTDVSNLVKNDVADLFSQENLSNLIQSNNDIVQLGTVYGNIIAEDTIKTFTDFDDLYTNSGKKVEAEYAVLVSGKRNYMDTTFVYVYYNGKIEKAENQNGKYIIQ